jgi:hypothetical protein
MSKIPDGTIKLLDQEAKDAQAQREKIRRVAIEIEGIALREGLTVGDLLEVFGLFTQRANKVFEKITIKEVKEKYERT